MDNTPPLQVEIDAQPGHYIRRLHQISVAIFLQETQAHGVTPVQYAALQMVGNQAGIDQRTLAKAIGLDTSTVAGVVDRLELRGLLVRNAAPQDKRVRQLVLTEAGRDLLGEIVPSMLRAQQLILKPLSAEDQVVFMGLLQQLVTHNNALSRAPSEVGR